MHDKYGTPVKVGDIVTVAFVVKDVSATKEHCNCTLESVEPMYPTDNKSILVINTKQCVNQSD